MNESNFDWKRQPETDQMFRQLVDEFCETSKFLNELRTRMLEESGTRLIDWVDHIAISPNKRWNESLAEERITECGYTFEHSDEHGKWFTHEEGIFVPICISDSTPRLVLHVDAVDDFLAAHRIFNTIIEGGRWQQLRKAKIAEGEFDLWVCERQGYASWSLPEPSTNKELLAIKHYESFKLRERDCETDSKGFALTKSLIQSAIDDIGVDWACDLFFAAERDYWQRRNRAARVQKARQDCLGLGWANHDHHTYRSSRQGFKDLIDILELLGFFCRERFYAGEEAGWGAQVLEQPGCGIVIFADVDLTASELEGDFAHDGLTEQAKLGTVGVWCQLHGEALLQAGMHHLECTFEIEAAIKQLETEGITTMAMFTDFGYLRQAFTTGEVWKPIESRTLEAVEKGWITQGEADKFLANGTVGSHMEVLERNDGFKGFNQTGVSDIIRKTDPRKLNLKTP